MASSQESKQKVQNLGYIIISSISVLSLYRIGKTFYADESVLIPEDEDNLQRLVENLRRST